MTQPLPLSVLELVCSRICHDLVSPVGAVNNGVELCQELDGDMAGEAMSLIAESGRRAAARLQLFRLAFGAAGGQAGVGPGDVRGVLADYLAGGKVALDWSAPAGGDPAWPAGSGRLVALALLIMEEALVHGGRISVETGALPEAITLTARGRTAALSGESEAALQGRAGPAELTPRTVVGHVLNRFAAAYGASVGLMPGGADPEGQARLCLVLGLADGK